MNDIQGINGSRPVRVIKPQMTPTNNTTPTAYTPQAGTDEVEISPIARYLSQVATIPDIRDDKVQDVRTALADGSYDVDGNLSQALDALLDEHA